MGNVLVAMDALLVFVAGFAPCFFVLFAFECESQYFILLRRSLFFSDSFGPSFVTYLWILLFRCSFDCSGYILVCDPFVVLSIFIFLSGCLSFLLWFVQPFVLSFCLLPVSISCVVFPLYLVLLLGCFALLCIFFASLLICFAVALSFALIYLALLCFCVASLLLLC